MGQRRAGDDIRICGANLGNQLMPAVPSNSAVSPTYHGRQADVFLTQYDRIPADQAITPGHASSPSST
jgi:hypothetical protein